MSVQAALSLFSVSPPLPTPPVPPKSISLLMIARLGKFVEFSVFGKETSVDWTIISDAKGNRFEI